MKQTIHYLFMLLLMLLTGVGGVKADEVTFDAKTDVTETVVNGYYSDVKSYEASDGSVWKATGHSLKQGDNITIGKGGANYLETPEVNGTITSITVTWKGNTKYYLALQTIEGVELNFKNNPSSTEYKTETFTVDGNYKQLRLVGRRNSGTENAAAIIQKVVVAYDPAIPYTITLGDDNTTLTEASAGAGVMLPGRENVGVYYFAGWSEISLGSEETTTKPDYVNAGNYYPSKNVTLYPVYTHLEGSGEMKEVLAQTLQYDTWSYNGSTTDKSSYRLFHSGSYVESAKFDLGTLSKVVVYGGTFGGSDYNKLTIGDGENIWKVVTVSGSSQTGKNTYTDGAALSGNGKLRVTSNSGTTSSTGVRISKIEIYVNQVVGVIYYIQTPNTETPVQKVDVAVLNSITPTTLNVNDKGEFTLDAAFAEGTVANEDYEVSWESDNAEVLAVSGASYEAKKEGTANVTVKVTVLDDEKYNEVSKSFAVTVNDPNAPGTQNNPYTVAQALANTPASGNSAEVYVKGIVSGFYGTNTNILSDNSHRYYIYDDGTETDQLLVYNGKGLNNVAFSSAEDVQVGDVVVIKGQLTTYQGTKEFAKDNYIVSLTRKEKVDADLAFTSTEVTAVRGDAFTAPTLTNKYNVPVVYTSSNKSVATVAEDGTVTLLKAGTTTITAAFVGNDDYKAGEASYTLTVTVPSHTATFIVNGQQQGELATVAEDEAIPFPTNVAEELLGKKFVGWTTAAIDGETDDKPTTLVNAATMGNEDVTYYAVFANKEGTFENASIKIDANTEGVPSSYGTANTFAEHMLAGKKFQIQQMYKNGDKLQWRAAGNNSGTGTMYNSEAIKSIQSVVLNYDASDSNKNFTVKVGSEANPTNGNEITATTDGSIQTFDCAAQNCDYFVLTNGSGAGYLTSLTINYLLGSVTYSGYCTTLTLAAPTFSLAAGEVEKGTVVTISAEEGATLKYTVGEVAMTSESNTATVAINEDVTIKAVAVKDGVESEEVSAAYTVKAEEPVVEPGTPAAITAGFYTIKNLGNEKFVNVAGRKTATLVDNAEGMAGTVIQVESDADGIVKTLRSQGVDVPGYATRAMKYVPDVVKLVVEKLHVSGSGEILGETGVDKILDKFNKSVDVNLHVVHADGGYRIYGKTPSMTPVKEFYQENKANVDAKLPGLEQAINDAIATIVDKVGKGESLKNTFKLETIWERMGKTLKEPGTEEATQVEFLQQVLANEENIWNFAYQTAMFYMEWVEGKQAFQEMQEKAPELMKYWNLAKKVRPNFMYYIVQKDDKVDVISQGNEAILNNDKSTVWALEEVSEFKVNLATPVEKTVYPTSNDGETTSYTEYYGTLYTDFAYQLPEGVTAYKVTGINKVGDKAYVKKAELNSEIVPAQTPVLLIANTGELTLTIAEGGEAVADNQLYGNDYLINEYDINTPQLEGVFNLLAELSQSTYDKYEYLMRKNAGTVNNKYFFGIAVEGELNEAYYAKTGKEMESSPVLKLGLTDGKVGFFETWDNLAGNEGFMFSEEESEILMNIVGDVNRDGTITISDVTALVNIILGKATYPADADKYDFEAADVNTDKTITISDVTALVNIILGK
ncbi:MAG: Ig-like domain-containing protein [Aeriscardovia sp.]|nr:Ig-like domain-containing protein [Aeriscardovia sp.]